MAEKGVGAKKGEGRKQMEEELRFQSKVIANMSEGVYIIRASDGVIVYANSKFEEIFGYDPGEIVGKHVSIVNAPTEKSPEETAEEIIEYINKTGEWRGEINNIKKDGTPFWCSASVTVFDHPEYGKVWIVVHTDITERKRTEEALEFRRNELEDIMRNVIDGIGVSDMQGKIIQANRALAEMYGYHSPDEVIGRPFFDFVAKEDLPRIAERFQEMMVKKEKTIKNIEMIGLKKDGSKFPEMINITNSWDKDGSLIGSFVVVHDITKRKRMEEALKESEERYKTLFRANADGVLIADSQTKKFIFANPVMCQMLGYSEGELTKLGVGDVHPKDKLGYIISEFEAHAGGERELLANIPCLRKDGQIIYVDIKGTTALVDGRKVNVGFFRDITERKQMEQELRETQEQLIRSEKLAAIGQLAGGVGHELRNPLSAIKNAVYYIKRKVAMSELAQKEPRVMEFLDIMDDEINSSNKIISDLLGFSRVGKPSVSPTQIRNVIEDALPHLTIPENIKLTGKLDADLPEVEIDADQIRQVFINVIMNAVEAMPEGGKLAIGANRRDEFLEVKIADTGCGIPQEAADKIFDPLFTTKAKGIGLGLSVCKAIIDRHQGDIEVESQVGKGTTFTIRLPLKAE